MVWIHKSILCSKYYIETFCNFRHAIMRTYNQVIGKMLNIFLKTCGVCTWKSDRCFIDGIQYEVCFLCNYNLLINACLTLNSHLYSQSHFGKLATLFSLSYLWCLSKSTKNNLVSTFSWHDLYKKQVQLTKKIAMKLLLRYKKWLNY